MKPGRDLDALVASKVMGIAICTCRKNVFLLANDWSACGECGKAICKRYSTDIAAAWEVLEKANLLSKFLFKKKPFRDDGFNDCNGNYAFVSYELDTMGSLGEWSHFTFAEAPTAPLAICLAALKACGVEV